MVEKQSKFKGISQQILQSYLQRMAALERVYQQSEEKNYRTFGKYRVKETFAGEESLTSLLTQYVERTVALHY